jgi:hypothetical protein
MVVKYPKIISLLFQNQIRFQGFSIFPCKLQCEVLSQEYRARVNIYLKDKLYFSYLMLRVHPAQIQFI